jgi:hypothetical protein
MNFVVAKANKLSSYFVSKVSVKIVTFGCASHVLYGCLKYLELVSVIIEVTIRVVLISG